MAGADIAFTSAEVETMLRGMAAEIDKRCAAHMPRFVGIRTGGAHLALRLAALLSAMRGQAILSGALDINLYRDDWSIKHHKPLVRRTEIDFDPQDMHVVLVDDVLYTGRTIRAALEALLDLGRPKRIELAVLVDRGGRELPIAPDYVGVVLPITAPGRVDVLLAEEGQQDAICVQHA